MNLSKEHERSSANSAHSLQWEVYKPTVGRRSKSSIMYIVAPMGYPKQSLFRRCMQFSLILLIAGTNYLESALALY
jgi:hypothetical protein